jgi:hypothetical protein
MPAFRLRLIEEQVPTTDAFRRRAPPTGGGSPGALSPGRHSTCCGQIARRSAGVTTIGSGDVGALRRPRDSPPLGRARVDRAPRPALVIPVRRIPDRKQTRCRGALFRFRTRRVHQTRVCGTLATCVVRASISEAAGRWCAKAAEGCFGRVAAVLMQVFALHSGRWPAADAESPSLRQSGIESDGVHRQCRPDRLPVAP